MAKASTATGEQNVVVEDIGPSRKRLTITVPAERVTDQIETSIEAVAMEAAIPGFRKGRVPRSLIERKFGSVVTGEARNQLIAAAYSEAVEKHSLRVVGEPEGKDLEDIEVKPGHDVVFSIEIEVAPEFDLPSLDGIEVKRPLIEVTDDMITKHVERLCTNEGDLVSQEKAADGDFCIGSGVMRRAEDGQEILKLEGAVIQVPTKDKEGRGAILGVLVEDFAKQIKHPKPGDTLKVKTKGPAQHENPEVREKDLEIEFQVERVERIQPLEVQQLVDRYGMGDESALRETISMQLNQRVAVEQQSAMRQQIARYLLDNTTMELPEGLTARQADRNLQRQRMEMMYQGVEPVQVEERIAELRGSSGDVARRELKLFFILAKIAETFQIGVEQDEVGARISQIAASRQMRPQDLYDQLSKQNQIGLIVQQIREHKAMDALLTKAKIEEISVEEFNKQMQTKDAAKA